jgi:hypothetical protein
MINDDQLGAGRVVDVDPDAWVYDRLAVRVVVVVIVVLAALRPRSRQVR